MIKSTILPHLGLCNKYLLSQKVMMNLVFYYHNFLDNYWRYWWGILWNHVSSSVSDDLRAPKATKSKSELCPKSVWFQAAQAVTIYEQHYVQTGEQFSSCLYDVEVVLTRRGKYCGSFNMKYFCRCSSPSVMQNLFTKYLWI